MARKVVFLDRDGTINVDHGYVYKIEDWVWTEGAIEGLKVLQSAGYTLTVITNQSGVGQNLYTEADMQKLHEYMKDELKAEGVELAAIAYCPHAREAGCLCRKPGTDMAKQIEREIGEIDYPNSWTIGDKAADMKFGKTLGTKTALIHSEYWKEEDLAEKPDIMATSLKEASEHIINS